MAAVIANAAGLFAGLESLSQLVDLCREANKGLGGRRMAQRVSTPKSAVQQGERVRGNGEGINPLALPPGSLIATTVELSMVQPTDGHGEMVADLRPLLRELDVAGI
jgi:hypothetical protein